MHRTKSVLVMIVVVTSACVASVPPHKTTAAPAAVGARGGSACPIVECGENGTRVTGLAQGDRTGTGTVHAVTLPSGEVISLP